MQPSKRQKLDGTLNDLMGDATTESPYLISYFDGVAEEVIVDSSGNSTVNSTGTVNLGDNSTVDSIGDSIVTVHSSVNLTGNITGDISSIDKRNSTNSNDSDDFTSADNLTGDNITNCKNVKPSTSNSRANKTKRFDSSCSDSDSSDSYDSGTESSNSDGDSDSVTDSNSDSDSDNSEDCGEIRKPLSLADLKRHEENKRVCKLHGFKPPLSFKQLRQVQFCYVTTLDKTQLKDGSTFLTVEDLTKIKRKIEKPFCHPGPELKGDGYQWYLADSIVQKVYLKEHLYPFFVVRWVGYDDNYNTVEPYAYVKDTAIFKLFENPNMCTGFRSNNGCIRRGGTSLISSVLPMASSVAPTKCGSTLNQLISLLQIEEKAGNYAPEIGFFSLTSVADALTMQHEFIQKKFIPLIKALKAPLSVGKQYIGMLGNLQRAAKFKKMRKWSVQSKSLKDNIYAGFREAKQNNKTDPFYACFFVPKKHNVNETSDEKQLNFHVCVYVIRLKDELKHAIYYNPSPPSFKCNLPESLDKLTDPKIQSVTNVFGSASAKDDCLFQCFQYIIGLATGDIEFVIDESKPARKYGEFQWKKTK